MATGNHPEHRCARDSGRVASRPVAPGPVAFLALTRPYAWSSSERGIGFGRARACRRPARCFGGSRRRSSRTSRPRSTRASNAARRTAHRSACGPAPCGRRPRLPNASSGEWRRDPTRERRTPRPVRERDPRRRSGWWAPHSAMTSRAMPRTYLRRASSSSVTSGPSAANRRSEGIAPPAAPGRHRRSERSIGRTPLPPPPDSILRGRPPPAVASQRAAPEAPRRQPHSLKGRTHSGAITERRPRSPCSPRHWCRPRWRQLGRGRYPQR